MSLSGFISSRYIKSRQDSNFISLISVISISGIALGVAVLIIALTILNGFEKVIEDKIDASYRDGILRVVMPYSEDEKTKKITRIVLK